MISEETLKRMDAYYDGIKSKDLFRLIAEVRRLRGELTRLGIAAGDALDSQRPWSGHERRGKVADYLRVVASLAPDFMEHEKGER